MPEYSLDDKSYKTSLFKDALGQINRLAAAWVRASYNRENGNLLGWRWILDSVCIELSYDIKKLKDENKGDYDKKLDEIEKDITSAFRKSDKPEQYKNLMKKEVLLREIQEASGKGSRWIDEEESLI